MNETKGGTSKRRKALSATLAIAMALVMLMSGTLAYFYQSRAVNKIIGTEKNVMAHDDFYKAATNADGSVVYNKDIYVENLGTEPVFVRVKLSEEFTLDGKKIVPAEGDDAVTHIPVNKDTLGVGTSAHDKKGEANVENIHDYFTWTMDNASDRTTYLSAKSDKYKKDDPSAKLSINANVAQDSSGEVYALGAENVKTLDATELWGVPEKVITMQEYEVMPEMNQKMFFGWVIDNSDETLVDVIGEDGQPTGEKETVKGDGWAYWSQMLPGGQATALLLDEVTVDAKLADRAYEYHINVDCEVVDRTDKGIWLAEQHTATNKPEGGINAQQVKTPGAQELLRIAEASGMSDTAAATGAEISAAMDAATSKSAKNLYQQALALVGDMEKSSFSQAKVNKLIAMAEDVEDRAKTEDLSTIVLEIAKEGETVTVTDNSSTELRSMEPAIAQYIVEQYGGGDHILTAEEALSVTKISYTPGASTVLNNITGISKKFFENLLEVELHADLQFTVDTSVFVSTDGASSIESLSLRGAYGKVSKLTTIDLTVLSDLVKADFVNLIGDSVDLQGIGELANMQWIYISHVNGTTLTDTELKNLIENNQQIEVFGMKYFGIYQADSAGTATDNLLTEITTEAYPFVKWTKLTDFQFSNNNIPSVIDLSICSDLHTVSIDNKVTVYVPNADTLANKVGDGTVISGPPPTTPPAP